VLWKFSVWTTSSAEPAVADWCQARFGERPVSYTDARTGKVEVSVFAPQARFPGVSQARLRARLAEATKPDGPAPHGTFSVRKIYPQDWAESWKRHFKPIEIGSALLIKPSWSKRRARKGQAVIVLDPGLSFGTGRHPTTAFCLRQLVARRNPARRQAFLDIGTGSGILAIAAALLGYSPVAAFDSDPVAVRAARANARRNAVLGRIRLDCANLTGLSGRNAPKYDVVCANLTSDLLMSESGRIIGRLKPGGIVIMAGILNREFAQLSQACRNAGLRLVASRSENEWRSGAFVGENLE
jgi:ribosomal protein L11 methyltransferase